MACVDRRRREQRTAERRRRCAGGIVVPRARGSVGCTCTREHGAHEGEAVRVQASRRQSEQDVAGTDVVTREELRALDGADCKACEIEVSCNGPAVRVLVSLSEGGKEGRARTGRVHPGHLGGLSSDKRTARLLAALRDAFNHVGSEGDVELATGVVIEEVQRLCPLYKQIVHGHGY